MTPIDQLTQDLATAQAEIARLRGALQRFVTDAINVDLGGADAVATTCESLEIATKALSQSPPSLALQENKQ